MRELNARRREGPYLDGPLKDYRAAAMRDAIPNAKNGDSHYVWDDQRHGWTETPGPCPAATAFRMPFTPRATA